MCELIDVKVYNEKYLIFYFLSFFEITFNFLEVQIEINLENFCL
jgi:hypothetical protein